MLNVVALMGRLTADPELRTTPNGASVTTFTLAVDRSYTPKGQERQADFINVVAWRSTAEFICRYFAKGQMIAVSGSIQTRNYEDKQGNKRTAFEVLASRVSFTGSKSESNGQSSYSGSSPSAQKTAAPYSSGSSEGFEEIMGDDDLPF